MLKYIASLYIISDSVAGSIICKLHSCGGDHSDLVITTVCAVLTNLS